MAFVEINKSFFGVPEDDQNFNLPAAVDAYHQIMAMDDDSARYLVSSLVFDKSAEEIRKNKFKIQQFVDEFYADRAQRISTALKRQYISKGLKGEDVSQLEAAYEAVQKAYNPFEHPRGGDTANAGRFSHYWGSHATSSHNVAYMQTRGPLPDKTALERHGIPAPEGKLSARQRSEYQQAYHQVQQQLDRYTRVPGLASGTTVDYVFENNAGHRTTQVVPGLEQPTYGPNKRLVEFHINVPNDLTTGGAGLNLLQALSGDRAGLAVAGSASAVGPSLRSFESEWNKPTYGGANNEPFYGRLNAASQLADELIPNKAIKSKLAIKTGKFVGEYGPEAEKVLGPHARKSAYRYRGVEKAPDPDVVAQIDKLREASGGSRNLVRGEALGGMRSGTRPGQEARFEQGFLVQYLANRLPKKDLSELQLKSGVTPPSQGFIIDAKGKVVTEAVGYGDDHYLPFNLRNLGKLRGGEYIRTRSVGGPTTEDIYAGLVSGARSLTVVSRSGVFTINFDDTFRGTRRYSDKAARMVNRYGKLLDAVKEGDVTLQDISPERYDEITNEVDRDFKYADKKTRKDEFDRRLAEERRNPQPSQAEAVKMNRQAINEARGDKHIENQIWLELNQKYRNEHTYKKMELNAAGYSAAMQSLKEQFPYYFGSVQIYPLREAEFTPGAQDKGYVKPRYLRPEAALAGYFDPTIAGAGTYPAEHGGGVTGKTTADRTNYANWRYNRLNPQAAQVLKERAANKPEAEAESTGAAAPVPEKRALDKKADAAYELYRNFRNIPEITVNGGALTMDWENTKKFPDLVPLVGEPMRQEEFDRRYKTEPGFAPKMNEAFRVFSVQHPPAAEEYRKFRDIDEFDKPKAYSDELGMKENGPFDFGIPANGSPVVYEAALAAPRMQDIAEEADVLGGRSEADNADRLVEHYRDRIERRRREDRAGSVNRTEKLSEAELLRGLRNAHEYRTLLNQKAAAAAPINGVVQPEPEVMTLDQAARQAGYVRPETHRALGPGGVHDITS